MVNLSDMTLGLATMFDHTLTSLAGFNRVLKAANLRSDGGKGRGARDMTGQDIAITGIALASGVGMTAAPTFVQGVVDMELKNGVLYQNGELTAWNPLDLPPVTSVLSKMRQDLLPGVQIQRTFGPFISNWIDGLYDQSLPWKQEGELTLVIRHTGPCADLVMEWEGNRLELGFAAPGIDIGQKPAWDRQIVMRGELFREMVKIIEG